MRKTFTRKTAIYINSKSELLDVYYLNFQIAISSFHLVRSHPTPSAALKGPQWPSKALRGPHLLGSSGRLIQVVIKLDYEFCVMKLDSDKLYHNLSSNVLIMPLNDKSRKAGRTTKAGQTFIWTNTRKTTVPEKTGRRPYRQYRVDVYRFGSTLQFQK